VKFGTLVKVFFMMGHSLLGRALAVPSAHIKILTTKNTKYAKKHENHVPYPQAIRSIAGGVWDWSISKAVTRGNEFCPKAKLAVPKAIRSIAGGSGERVPPKRGVAGPAIEAPQRG